MSLPTPLRGAYIGALYDNVLAGRISAEDARLIEDEITPRCDRCGTLPQKTILPCGDAVCVACAQEADLASVALAYRRPMPEPPHSPLLPLDVRGTPAAVPHSYRKAGR